METALQRSSADTAESTAPAASADLADVEPMFDLIELLFFAYRDFVGDADRLLEAYQFGRAHHRVLHFVTRNPGLTIAELLDILKITKQSLNRVLKELLDKGYVESRAGALDRRQRQLFPTQAGTALALEIARVQSRRFRRVFGQLQKSARLDAMAFLLAMIDPGEKDKVATRVASGARFAARTASARDES
jgi:DNA-binding MarR family transcriptional regulator